VVCRDEIVPDAVGSVRLGPRTVYGDLTSRIITRKKAHEGQRRTFHLRNVLETLQQFLMDRVHG